VRWSDIRFEPELFDSILEYCPSVKSIARQTDDEFTISFGSRTEQNVDVKGIDPSWHEIEDRTVILGRKFDRIDNLNARAVCLSTQNYRNSSACDRPTTSLCSSAIGGTPSWHRRILERTACGATCMDARHHADRLSAWDGITVAATRQFASIGFDDAHDGVPPIADEQRLSVGSVGRPSFPVVLR